MGFPRNEALEIVYNYDFALEGGAISSISLSADLNSLGEGVIVKSCFFIVKSPLTSAGAPTVTLGNTTDPDGYLADFYALANADGNVINSGEVAGALIWDDTNDHKIYYPINATAANQDCVLAIGTAALTGGKLEIHFECAFDQV